jgi:ArsR family transcriptional regulator, arsenate/arsenite/antimonite-responsive transcriptional repressor
MTRSPLPLPVFSALGHATRWRAFELLLDAGDGGMRQGDISKSVGVDKNLMSTHLKVMREAGLVTAEKIGREVTYRVVASAAGRAGELIGKTIAGARTSKHD